MKKQVSTYSMLSPLLIVREMERHEISKGV